LVAMLLLLERGRRKSCVGNVLSRRPPGTAGGPVEDALCWSKPPVTVRRTSVLPGSCSGWWEEDAGSKAGRERMKPRRLTALLIACLLLAAAGCGGGGGDESGDGGDNAITFWSAEDNAERVKVLQGIVDEFQTKSGVQVKLVTIAEDQLASQIQSASAAGSLPDVMGSLSLGFAHSLAADDLADGDAANEVIERLAATPSPSAPSPWSRATASRSASPPTPGPSCWSTARTCSRRRGWRPPTPSRRSRPPRPSSTSRARPGSSPPPRPPTASPSRPSSTSPSPTAASSPTTRAPSS